MKVKKQMIYDLEFIEMSLAELKDMVSKFEESDAQELIINELRGHDENGEIDRYRIVTIKK